ncbi:permease [Bacillus sp. 03113]|uniref:permease n=1 Tax=Bacillus sp. 03113 TaxID=2578211 RepID=UPI00114493D6
MVVSFVLRAAKDCFIFLLFCLFLFLFLFSERVTNNSIISNVPPLFLNVHTIFLSILLEAIPFILLGVFVSAIIQTFVSEKMIQKLIPKNAYLALIPAGLLGIIFPICECAIIPVARRLIKKGMPAHVGIVFMLSAPIINPVVYASTFFAFRNLPNIANSRMIIGFICSIIIGMIVYRNHNGQTVIKENKLYPPHNQHHEHVPQNRLLEILNHASDELFDTGKFLIIGAFMASLFQALLDRNLLVSIGSNPIFAPGIMMGFAYVLSICSEADAFVASSFGSNFTEASLLAFLVFGPMLDVKNTMMLFAYFKKRFVCFLIALTIVVVYVVICLYQLF